MATFRPISENELAGLSDEAVVAYIEMAREAGRVDLAKHASGILAFGFWDSVRYQVFLKLRGLPDDVEDVTSQVMESAMKSLFDGRSVGEFRSWLATIRKRRIADYYRAKERKPVSEHLPGGGSDEDTGPEPGREDEEYVAVEIREIAARLLEARSDIHQLVIRLYGANVIGYLGLPAAEVVGRVEAANPGTTMSDANVHQIWSRFKQELNHELGLGGS